MTVALLAMTSLLTPRRAAAQDTSAVRRDTASKSDTAEAADTSTVRSPLYFRVRPSVSSGRTYNRVEGLPVLVGATMEMENDKVAIDGAAYGILRSGRDWSAAEPDAGHDAHLRARFGPDKTIGLSGRLFDVVAPIERWQLSEPEEGLASFLLRRDYLDYYTRHGGRVEASWDVNAKATLTAGYGVERWGSIDTRNPFTLFRPAGNWRSNPLVDEGLFHILTLGGVLDTRNDDREPSAGWYITGEYEYGASPAVTRAPQIQDSLAALPPTSPVRVAYGRAFLDLRRYNRLSPRTQINARLVAAGWVNGDELPLERKLSVSGPGTIPGYDFREAYGTPDAMQCVPSGASASVNPALCDRAVLGQLEFRTELSSQPYQLFNIPASAVQKCRLHCAAGGRSVHRLRTRVAHDGAVAVAIQGRCRSWNRSRAARRLRREGGDRLEGTGEHLRAHPAQILIVRRAVVALVALVAMLTMARVALAQSPRVEIVLPPRAELATTPPSIRTEGVLASGRTPDLIHNGFPARLHYKLERWDAGTLVNDVKATSEWEIIAEYDPLSNVYRLIRATPQRATVVGEFTDIKDADAQLAEPYVAQIKPPRAGEKSYYALSLEVEAMSLSDLDEVRRWLRGDLRPAVRGRRDPGAAVSSGVRTLFVRILGGERIEYQATTGVFRP